MRIEIAIGCICGWSYGVCFFWSLLVPAIEQAQITMGKWAVVPAVIGFCSGMLFLLLLDCFILHMHIDETFEGPKSNFRKSTMLVFAVVIHNIPEGMAVGALFAGWMQGNNFISINYCTSYASIIKFCCRSYDLCCNRRIDS